MSRAVNTFELDRTDEGIHVWVWEYWLGNTRLDASMDLSVAEAHELAAMLTEYADKDAPTEAAAAHAEFEEDLRRESMYDFMTSPMEKK